MQSLACVEVVYVVRHDERLASQNIFCIMFCKAAMYYFFYLEISFLLKFLSKNKISDNFILWA